MLRRNFFTQAGCLPVKSVLILMTDFGLRDGAVSAMKGVAYSVDKSSIIADLTHDIDAFDVHEAAYRLYQVMQYYPQGSVFVCVIDPGVGTVRRSVVAKTRNGYYVVAPDNGILTYIIHHYGLEEVRCIDETRHRLSHSLESNTFHGRDVYAYTGAKLAAGVISFDQVGPRLGDDVVILPIKEAAIINDTIYGQILTLDGIYGNLWTNIDAEMLKKVGIFGEQSIKIQIVQDGSIVYENEILFSSTFGVVGKLEPVAYINSLGNLALALNQGNFAETFGIARGYDIRIARAG